MQVCLPTWEFGPMATEAVAPIVYTRLSLTNRLGGCLVTLCSWGAQRSSAHTPVSRSSSLPMIFPKVTASLCSTTTSVVGEQAYSDHFGGHRATGQWTKQRTGNGTQHTPSLPGELDRFWIVITLEEPDRGDKQTLFMTHLCLGFNRVQEEHAE